jgi:riboflavin kinase/FMN adenylyltransferase
MIEKAFTTAITIGVFDGVHLGHLSLLRKVNEVAEKYGAVSTAITFDPIPDEYFHREKGILLTLPEEKKKLLMESGINYTVFLEFNEKVANLDKNLFLEKIGKLNPVAVVVGEDFRFGRNAEGTPEDIKNYFKSSVEVIVMPLLAKDGEPIKSSRIRRLISSGDVRSARNLLGRYYTVSGEVVPGKSLGKALGYPTANIEINSRKLIPSSGVYAGISVVDGRDSYPSAVFVPENQKNGKPTVEAHLLNFSGDLYGSRITVNFVERVSDVVKMAKLEDLQKKISQDIEMVETILLKRL